MNRMIVNYTGKDFGWTSGSICQNSAYNPSYDFAPNYRHGEQVLSRLEGQRRNSIRKQVGEIDF